MDLSKSKICYGWIFNSQLNNNEYYTLQIAKFINLVILENIPQLYFQIQILAAVNDGDDEYEYNQTFILIFSMIFSILSILFALLNVISLFNYYIIVIIIRRIRNLTNLMKWILKCNY